MSRNFRTLLSWTLILSACTPGGLSTKTAPPTLTSVRPTPVVIVTDTAVPSSPQDCGYQWAQQTLPDLSSSFQGSIQSLQPEAQAYAFAFGENCVHADGGVDFLPMETDFNITLQVSDLANETDLGGWIVKVMQVIEAIPADQIVGPRPGRVSIEFQSGGNPNFVRFYIDRYQALPLGLSPAEVYKTLLVQQ